MHDIDQALFETEQAYEAYEGPGALHETFESESYESLESGYESDSREMELATELLEITSEEELEEFLGSLLGSAVSAARGFAQSATGRALGGMLKNAARQVLPQVGQVIGNAVSPGSGGQMGQRAGQWLSRQFEYEGLSAEDRELEAARGFVRVSGDAARRAVAAGPAAPPQQAAHAALVAAARRSMPGLVPLLSTSAGARAATGQWVRRGNRIVLFGA